MQMGPLQRHNFINIMARKEQPPAGEEGGPVNPKFKETVTQDKYIQNHHKVQDSCPPWWLEISVNSA